MPAFTAVPTASAVCALGAVPVPVDVDAATAAMDLDACRRRRSPSGRGRSCPVHLYGRPAPLPDLGVPVLEDAAQAHGALDGVGGAAAVYSFYPTKNLGGIGDGGAVVTDDDELAARGAAAAGARHDRAVRPHRHLAELPDVRAGGGLDAARAARPGRRQRTAPRRRPRPTAPPRRSCCWHADHPRHVHHLCVVRSPDRDRWRAALAERDVATGRALPAGPDGAARLRGASRGGRAPRPRRGRRRARRCPASPS